MKIPWSSEGELSEVEVAQSLEQDLVLREMRLVALQTASDTASS